MCMVMYYHNSMDVRVPWTRLLTDFSILLLFNCTDHVNDQVYVIQDNPRWDWWIIQV